MKRVFFLVVLVATFFLPFTTAQVDPRARVLLDGFGESFAAQAQAQPETLETTDMTTCYTFYEGGEAQSEMCVRQVMDFVNRRMYNETRSQFGDEPETFKLIYKDGRATVKDSFSEIEGLELPKAQLAEMEGMFEQMFDRIAGGAAALPDDYERATYDGRVRYGNVLAGEKVTVTTALPVALPGQSQSPSGKLDVSYVFDRGLSVGAVFRDPQRGTILQVYTNPEDPVPYRRFVNSTTYTLKGKTPTLTGKIKVTRYRLNPKLNDALFTFGGPE